MALFRGVGLVVTNLSHWGFLLCVFLACVYVLIIVFPLSPCLCYPPIYGFTPHSCGFIRHYSCIVWHAYALFFTFWGAVVNFVRNGFIFYGDIYSLNFLFCILCWFDGYLSIIFWVFSFGGIFRGSLLQWWAVWSHFFSYTQSYFFLSLWRWDLLCSFLDFPSVVLVMAVLWRVWHCEIFMNDPLPCNNYENLIDTLWVFIFNHSYGHPCPIFLFFDGSEIFVGLNTCSKSVP